MKIKALLSLLILIVPIFSSAQLVEGGREHTIILCGDSTVWTTGQNGNGQIGDGTLSDRTTAVQVAISSVKAVAAGDFHSLALRSDGTVWAWGSNLFGQLGDASNTQRTSPVQVTGLANIVKIDAGVFFSMALRSDGTVWTWGQGLFGQLGNGASINSNVPVQVSGITNIEEIAAGASHALAVSQAGVVYGWGQNSFGEVGDSSITLRNIPVLTNLIPNNIIQLEAGNNFSLGLSDIGEIWAWGYNVGGQLGDNSFDSRREPNKIPGNRVFVSIAAGKWHSSAITVDGKFWTWGYNRYGQVADGGYSSHAAPYHVSSIVDAAQIGAGAGHNLVLLADSTVWAVGHGEFGQIGNVAAMDSTTVPLQTTLSCKPNPPCITPVSNFTMIDSVLQVSFTDLSSGGSSLFWDFGDGNNSSVANPVHSYSGGGTYTICLIITNNCGADTFCNSITVSCIPMADFTVVRSQLSVDFTDASFGATSWAWDFGDGNNSTSTSPSYTYAIKGNYTVTLIATNGCGSDTSIQDIFVSEAILSGNINYNVIAGGSNHSIVRCDDGSAMSTGSNTQHQLGDTSSGNVTIPIPVMNMANVATLESGNEFNLVIRDDGTVWSWGFNNLGQLGDSTSGFTTSRGVPKQVPGLSDIIEVSGGSWHSLALDANGNVYAWGWGTQGQLGDGQNESRPYPGLVLDLQNIINIRAGGSHAVALRSDGTVWAWGSNSFKQLGDPALGALSNLPNQVPYLDNVVQIATGGNHSLARKADGTVWAWGANFFGQVGDSTFGFGANKDSAVQVHDLTDVIDISANLNHSMAVKSDGTVWTWGGNAQGQIGDSTTGFANNRPEPVQVWNLTNAIAVSAAVNHSLALADDGIVWGWGANFLGQLGDATIVSSLVPSQMKPPCIVDLPCPVPVADFSWEVDFMYMGEVHFTNLSSGYDSVLWDLGYGGTYSTIGVSYTYNIDSSLGSSEVACLTVYNKCGSDSVCKLVWPLWEGIQEYGARRLVKIFPNPFDRTTTFRIERSQNWDLMIYDLVGKAVFEETSIRSTEYLFSRESLPSGIYFYNVRSGAERLGTGKLIMQ